MHDICAQNNALLARTPERNFIVLENPASQKRLLVGSIAGGAFLVTLILWIFFPDQSQTAGVLLRVAITLGALCLAMPSQHQPAAWAKMTPMGMIFLLGGIILSVRYPWVLGPLFLLLGILSLFSLRRQQK